MLVAVGRPSASLVHGEETPKLRLTTFRCEVAPPIGYMIGWEQPMTSVKDPLWAKGVVVEDQGRRHVLCAVDWCLMSNSTHDLFRRKLAEAAGADTSRVAVHTVHQHTAPRVDDELQQLLDREGIPYQYTDAGFSDKVTDRVAAALRKSLDRLQPFDHVGTGQAKVERVASSRRLPLPNGKVRWRGSAGARNPELAAAPEGRIDPMLKTITLARGDKPIVRLHYYAVHPQTCNGDGRAWSDAPGYARERLEADDGAFQIYFTGCAGDVGMGKYNDATELARQQLTNRLYAGMAASIAATRLTPAARIRWRTVSLRLPVRTEAGDTAADYRAKMHDPKLSLPKRVAAARHVVFTERIERPIELSCLEIGPASVVHLPGESLIEFQLYAQQLAPDRCVAVASYGDWGPGYVCTEQAFVEGGYEPGSCNSGRGTEATLKKAIRQLLAVD
jgi:hypothetical protein